MNAPWKNVVVSFLSLSHTHPWANAGWSSRIEYEPGTGPLAVFPSVHLETCDEPVASVQATVELETSHIGKGCDRDTYSEKSLHRLCGKEVYSLEPVVFREAGPLGPQAVKCWLEQTRYAEVACAALPSGYHSGRARGVHRPCRINSELSVCLQ